MVTAIRIDVRLTQKQVLMTIHHLNQKMGIYPLSALAERAECGINTANRHVKQLQHAGYVHIVIGTGKRPNQYIITDEGMKRINELQSIRVLSPKNR